MQTGQVLIGIDPGVNGYIAQMERATGAMAVNPIGDIYQAMNFIGPGDFVVAEKVQPRPSQSLKGVVTSCVNYGRLKASLYWNQHDPIWVTPQQWQKKLGLNRRWERPSGMTDEEFSTWKYQERKRLHKQAVIDMKLYDKPTLANADAILICEYARRLWQQKTS